MASKTYDFSNSFQTTMPYEITFSKKTILQNKAQTTQLQKELKALTKAEIIELRSQETKELQFRTKYEKYLTRGNFETSLIKKDGFKKVTAQTHLAKVNSLEYVPLHKLIYTKGEVDIEKVICLHLLSVQQVNINSFPDKRTLRLFAKRSKPSILEASALPFYILKIIHQVDIELKSDIREGQDVIILVNNNLEKLILSILEVLAIVSPQKLQQIIKLSFNKKAIQEIMIKTKISNFLAQAKGNPMLFEMENYRLEVAQFQETPSLVPNVLSVCHIKVKDKSKKLESILTEIKNRISEYTEEDITSSESWSMFHRKFCNCKKVSSRPSVTSGNAIALLSDDGTEFAVVTGAGCSLPTGSSIFCPSLTAIIKSSPRHHYFNSLDVSSGFSLHQRGLPVLKNVQNKLISSILHKVNNSQRILIGKKEAEFKSPNIIKAKPDKLKTPINQILEKVFSKQSLISFASNIENEELKLLFQPCCKGGLDIGSFILEPEKVKTNNARLSSRFNPTWEFEDAVPQMINQENSIMNTALIKQEIFTSETRTKMKQFLLSDNPGHKPPGK